MCSTPPFSRRVWRTATYEARPDDSLQLNGAMITNAVRCVPPQNKPTGVEARTCRPFLTARIEALPNLRAILALGRVAHDNTARALERKDLIPLFAHGAQHTVHVNGRAVALIDSYHCSRYNVNTGRLTVEMFDEVVGMLARASA